MHLSSSYTDLQNTDLFMLSISWWMLIKSDALNEQEAIPNSQRITCFFFQLSASLLVGNTLKYIEMLRYFLHWRNIEEISCISLPNRTQFIWIVLKSCLNRFQNISTLNGRGRWGAERSSHNQSSATFSHTSLWGWMGFTWTYWGNW